MRFYTEQHKHYCGIDLHTNKMDLCILRELPTGQRGASFAPADVGDNT
jgi:hypothetical protein